MKSFIKFLDQNNISYKIQKYGNFLYIPAEPIEGITISIDYNDSNKTIVENYLKRHKKNLYFESRLNASASYMEYFFKIFDSQEYKQFTNVSNFDSRLIEKYHQIRHVDGLKAAEQYYKSTMLKYNGITA